MSNVIDFSDMMILSLAFPNIIGAVILSKKIVPLAKDYVTRLRNGEIKTAEETAGTQSETRRKLTRQLPSR